MRNNFLTTKTARVVFPQKVGMSIAKRYVSETMSKKITMVTESTFTEEGIVEAPVRDNYLRTLSKKELFSLGMIAATTINKPILDFSIKAFPYMPLFLTKSLIFPLYCGGETSSEVIETGKRLRRRGINNMMLSLTIEDSEGTKNIDINYIVEETIASVNNILKPLITEHLEAGNDVNSIPPGYLALKPSALVSNPVEVLLNFNNPEWKAQRDVLVNNCVRITQAIYDLNRELYEKYPGRTSPFLVSTIDAEKYKLQKAGVYELQRILFSKFNPVDAPFVSCIGTWQLYLVDSADDLAKDLEQAKKGAYRLGLKLVRGAYLHSEPSRSTIHASKSDTDANYNYVLTKVIKDLLENGNNSYYGHLVVASHNYESQILATKLLKNSTNSVGASNVVLAQLLGMSDNITHDLVTNYGAKNIIKYVPWGPAIETKDYLLRRLQENGDAVRADNGLPLLKAVSRALLRL